MKKATGISNVKVVLTNMCTGREKEITMPDDHLIVASALTFFARVEDISVQRVDIQILPVKSHASVSTLSITRDR